MATSRTIRILQRLTAGAVLSVGLLVLLLSGAPASLAAASFDLQAALQQARAGDTVNVPAGVYHGPITVDKPVTLQGAPGAILDGGGQGDVVLIKAAGATLRGFTIRASGSDIEKENTGVWVLAPLVTVEDNVLQDVLFGIYVKQAEHCTIRCNTIGGQQLDIARRGDAIRLWYSPNCLIDQNTAHDARDLVVWFSHDVHVTNNRVSRCRYGLHFMYCDNNEIRGNELEDNSVGTYLMFSRNLRLLGNTFANNRGSSGYGVGLKDMDNIVAEDNRVVGNRIGIYIDTSPQSIGVYNHFARNLIGYNDVGIAFLPNDKRNVFHANTFQENQEQVAVMGSGDFSGNDFSVAGRGNFWSDYKGYDMNRDGLGDVPYRSESFFENLMDREPRLRMFLYSPAQQALELASQAFPAVRPQPKFSDDHPLMAAVPVEAPAEASSVSWPMTGIAGAMLALAARVMTLTSAPRRARGSKRVIAQREPCGNAAQPVVSVRSLTKRFDSFTAVDSLSFDLSAGSALALWGTNGAGKTTALRCILGLIRCNQGTVTIAGHDLQRAGKLARSRIGYIPQTPGFQDDASVLDVMRFYARIKGAAPDRVNTLLGEVGLAGHERKRVGQLSGGMRKRLALAAALLNDPPLLVLDEMAANLDADARHAFLALLVRLKQQGKTILFTSHRLDEVQTLADRVLVLRSGRLDAECTPRELPAALGLACQVKLIVPSSEIDPALGILRSAGFAANRNGRGIWVRVEHDRNAAPIHVLAEHRIQTDSFEIADSDVMEHPHAEHH